MYAVISYVDFSQVKCSKILKVNAHIVKWIVFFHFVSFANKKKVKKCNYIAPLKYDGLIFVCFRQSASSVALGMTTLTQLHMALRHTHYKSTTWQTTCK